MRTAFRFVDVPTVHVYTCGSSEETTPEAAQAAVSRGILTPEPAGSVFQYATTDAATAADLNALRSALLDAQEAAGRERAARLAAEPEE